MPFVERDGASIYYEEHGSGFPVLLLAPGGMNSAVPFWERMPLNPIETFADEFRMIAMDQRNAHRSTGPLDTHDPWGMYADDQFAVLDHLGIDKALAIGSCIGSSFIFKLCERQPGRIVAGVPMQPIGDDHTNVGQFSSTFWVPWGENLIARGADLTPETIDAFGHALFDPGFVFSVSREFLKTLATPMLLLDGDDRAHPKGVSAEVAALLPNVERIEVWRDPGVVPAVTEQMRRFLQANTPVAAGS
jgi:pimeloyl-ACP methyl ester carboxylesterase